MSRVRYQPRGDRRVWKFVADLDSVDSEPYSRADSVRIADILRGEEVHREAQKGPGAEPGRLHCPGKLGAPVNYSEYSR